MASNDLFSRPFLARKNASREHGFKLSIVTGGEEDKRKVVSPWITYVCLSKVTGGYRSFPTAKPLIVIRWMGRSSPGGLGWHAIHASLVEN